MSGLLAVSPEAGAAGPPPYHRGEASREAASILLLSAWCGLAGGLLEVGITEVRRRLIDLNPLAPLPRDYLWQVPLADVMILLAIGASCRCRSGWRVAGGGSGVGCSVH